MVDNPYRCIQRLPAHRYHNYSSLPHCGRGKTQKEKTYKTDYDRNDIIKKLDELSADNADTEEKAPAENLDDYDEPIEETADNVVSSETDNAESDVTETADGTETEIKTAETEEKPAPTENTSSDNSSETDLDD